MWNVAKAVFNTVNPCLFPKVRNLYPTAVCLQSLQVSGGNPIPECSQLTVTEAICWKINSFPTGKTRQVKHEKFSHSHCLIHDRDKTACGHEAEQLAVWCSRNNLGPHATESWKDGAPLPHICINYSTVKVATEFELSQDYEMDKLHEQMWCRADHEIWAN